MNIDITLLNTPDAWNIDARAGDMTDEQAQEIADSATEHLSSKLRDEIERVYPGVVVEIEWSTELDDITAYTDDDLDENAVAFVEETIRGAWDECLRLACDEYNAAHQ